MGKSADVKVMLLISTDKKYIRLHKTIYNYKLHLYLLILLPTYQANSQMC